MADRLQARPVILDVDTGIDDAWALAYAAASPRLDILGITTVFGNADLDTTTRNTLLMLELLTRDIPVYRGASRPLIREWTGPVPAFHGHNGLGDAPLPPVTRTAAKTDAAAFMAETIAQRPGEVTLVMVARLTNLARALLAHPDLSEKIDRVVMMGGAAFCPGNVTAVAEANIWGDPEAADIVFQSGVPITMVGLDVTMKAQLTRRDVDGWQAHQAWAEILRQATRYYIDAYQTEASAPTESCPLHDPLAVAVAEDPTLITTARYPVRVETRGLLTDGMTVVDARDPAQSGATVALDLDTVRFLSRFKARLGMD